MFTTGLGVRSWLAGAEGLGLGDELLEVLRSALVLARGPKAVGAALTAGIDVDWCTPNSRNAELMEHLADAHRSGSLPIGDGHTVPRVAVQLDGSPDEWMATAVADLGVDAVAVPIYRWELPEDRSQARRVLQGVVDGSIDAVTFTAAHAVTNFFTIADELGLTDEVLAAFATGATVAVVVGPVCADRARSFGIVDTIEPVTPRLGAMVRAFAADFTDRRRALTLGGHLVTLQGRMARVGDGDPVLLSDREREVLAVLSDRPGRRGVEGRAAAPGVGRRDRRARGRGDRRSTPPATDGGRRRHRDRGAPRLPPQRGLTSPQPSRRPPDSTTHPPRGG